jgi:isoquinoline 1-oxidoreductase beta subunit
MLQIFNQSAMKKWTRRAFIGAGLPSGAVVIGTSIRPGNRSSKVAGLIAGRGNINDIWLENLSG